MPRVKRAIVERRRDRLAELVAGGTYLPVGELARRLDVSVVTARRDLAALDRQDRVRRTHGGAVSAGQYDRDFASFDARRGEHAAAKRAVADAALPLIGAGMGVFLDAGTTCHRLAERLRDAPPAGVSVLTQSLAVADLLAGTVRVTLTGGRLLPRQRTLVGPDALRSVRAARIDLAILAAESFGPEGLANSQRDVVDLQRAVLGRAGVGGHAWLMHAGKLGRDAPHPVAGWDEVGMLLTDAPPSATTALPTSAIRHVTPETE